MRQTMKFQPLALREPAERLPYQTPECRVFTFRGGDRLCDSGDLIDDEEGGGTGTGNSGEGPGYNNPDNP
ncbi:MAG: hypothetical protein IKE64_05510 [Thermoguttaceae bacterium]|nr:hypothetical protein [Thermoguttaceae bacterium]